MRIKQDVKTEGVQPQIWYAIGLIDGMWRSQVGTPAVITSLADSHESRPVSLHNKGLAADIRTRTLEPYFAREMWARIKHVLDPQGFDTVLEKDHLHVEFDPKPGEEWIQVVP